MQSKDIQARLRSKAYARNLTCMSDSGALSRVEWERFPFFKCGHHAGWKESVLYFVVGFLERAEKVLFLLGDRPSRFQKT